MVGTPQVVHAEHEEDVGKSDPRPGVEMDRAEAQRAFPELEEIFPWPMQ